MERLINKINKLKEYFENLENLNKEISDISITRQCFQTTIEAFEDNNDKVIEALNILSDENLNIICSFFLLDIQHDNTINIIKEMNI
jgi:hypothetical protein